MFLISWSRVSLTCILHLLYLIFTAGFLCTLLRFENLFLFCCCCCLILATAHILTRGRRCEAKTTRTTTTLKYQLGHINYSTFRIFDNQTGSNHKTRQTNTHTRTHMNIKPKSAATMTMENGGKRRRHSRTHTHTYRLARTHTHTHLRFIFSF